jgi:hypothetical protein
VYHRAIHLPPGLDTIMLLKRVGTCAPASCIRERRPPSTCRRSRAQRTELQAGPKGRNGSGLYISGGKDFRGVGYTPTRTG